jgi:hypothetical protein
VPSDAAIGQCAILRSPDNRSRADSHQRGGRLTLLAMIRISITPAAFDAIAASLPFGSTAFEPEPSPAGERHIWLEPRFVDRLAAMRGPGESYCDVILRLAKG